MIGLDLAFLRRYLDEAVPGLVRGELTGEVIEGGRSNLTYAVTDGISRWVVRRPPLGHVLDTAHDMGREYRVLTALFPTGYPVPETIVLGDSFYVMEFVEGTVHREALSLAPFVPSLIVNLVDRLADLHTIDPAAIGLGDFGRPEGYNERQVRRWKRQLDLSRSRSVAGLDELHARLAVAPPPVVQGAIVHGDYRIDNVLSSDVRIVAVLDWEMSTLGDPLSDLALLLLYTADRTLDVPGHPTLDDMVERYANRSGRDVSDLRWHRAQAAFKLAVISEGIHYRFTQGLTVGDGFDLVGERVAPLAAMGHDFLGGY